MDLFFMKMSYADGEKQVEKTGTPAYIDWFISLPAKITQRK